MLGLCMNSKQYYLKEMRVYLPKNFSELQKCLFYSAGSPHDEKFRQGLLTSSTKQNGSLILLFLKAAEDCKRYNILFFLGLY